jgi:hypothetical protein
MLWTQWKLYPIKFSWGNVYATGYFGKSISELQLQDKLRPYLEGNI